ncbi:MAG TPA: outer-membrane lipoprotein carrier protein LolA [bacterium]|nr:outer-membrane lipoprotein carrier protein LolA [bacterium]HXB98455.1 outer-membrane lipoprotein carrier protein LolA [bacterium]
MRTLLGLALAVPAFAADKPRYTAAEVFDQMLKAQEARAWWTAKVTKVEGPIQGGKSTTSEGLFSVKPGGLARLDIQKPSPGMILSDGKLLWVELPEVSQVMRYNAAKLKESGNFFLDLPSSIRHYAKASQRRLFVPGEGFDPARDCALELLPLHPSQAGFERLRVWVDEDRWVILRVQLDYGGTRSDVRFDDIKIGEQAAVAAGTVKDLDPALFRYQPPKGFEIFDLDL